MKTCYTLGGAQRGARLARLALWASLLYVSGSLDPAYISAQPANYVARVVATVRFPLDQASFSALTPARRAKLEQAGIRVLKNPRALQSAPLGLAGHWLEFGSKRYMTDKNGYVRVPTLPARTTQIKVFSQVDDALPIAALAKIRFVADGQAPQPTILELNYKPLGRMNPQRKGGTGASTCRKHKPCAPIGSPAANKIACCLDYNGPAPFGDGQPYVRTGKSQCAIKAYLNFLQSTCFQWTFLKPSRACLSESATAKMETTCWMDHKYRNCQSMSENDFSMTPSSAGVSFGQSLILSLRNNTAGNSTCLTVKGSPGRPMLQLASKTGSLSPAGACGGYRLDHFSDAQKKHYEQVELKFIAPDVPSTACEGVYQIDAEAGGLTQTAVIRAKREGCSGALWNGTITYERHLTISQINVRDNESLTRTLSHTTIIHVTQSRAVAAVKHSGLEHFEGHYTYSCGLQNQANDTTESAEGEQKASITVSLAQDGKYTIVAEPPSVSGTAVYKKRSWGCIDTRETTDTAQIEVKAPFDAAIEGSIDSSNPNVISGSTTKELPYATSSTGLDSPWRGRGTETRTVTWMLTRGGNAPR